MKDIYFLAQLSVVTIFLLHSHNTGEDMVHEPFHLFLSRGTVEGFTLRFHHWQHRETLHSPLFCAIER
jgi:hypothetical protein